MLAAESPVEPTPDLHSIRRVFMLSAATLGAETLLNLSDYVGEELNLSRRVVEIETGPAAGSDAKPVVERIGAVVSGADCDAMLIEHLGDIVGVNRAEREAHQAGAKLGHRAENSEAIDRLQPLVGVAG
jgi:hypothetical protein